MMRRGEPFGLGGWLGGQECMDILTFQAFCNCFRRSMCISLTLFQAERNEGYFKNSIVDQVP